MSGKIEHIIISAGHNFVGHSASLPGSNPGIQKDRVTLISGKGIMGDRYSEMEQGHSRQITFFEMETVEMLREHFGSPVKPEQVRRNVFVRGIDLAPLVGKEFTVQGIEFMGVDACPPCGWMDISVGDGSRKLMEGRGGLRAEILTDGVLSVGSAEFNQSKLGKAL